MRLISNPSELKQYLNNQTHNIGLVPTMGALHQGHLSLVESASKECELVVVSIFVNPTQFGPNEDFNKYPRSLNEDIELLRGFENLVVFSPGIQDVYLSNRNISIDCGELGKVLCGKTRPGHFNGVCLIVNKLFNLINPEKAYFGRKDFQQTVIIKKMVEELNLDTIVVVNQTIRDENGLALSSRNKYLSEIEKNQAYGIYKTLKEIKKCCLELKEVNQIRNAGLEVLSHFDYLKLDYLEIVSGYNLDKLDIIDAKDSPVAAIAVYCGMTRLIDNIELFG